MSFRDIKNAARRDLHGIMEVPAFYLATPGSSPVACTVRVHTKFDALGDVKGTSFDYAERRDEQPKLIFMRDQIDPRREALVTISADEGYRLGVVDPPDGITVSVAVVRLPINQMAGLPVPA